MVTPLSIVHRSSHWLPRRRRRVPETSYRLTTGSSALVFGRLGREIGVGGDGAHLGAGEQEIVGPAFLQPVADPLAQELENLRDDLRKVEETVRNDVRFDF